MASLINPGSFFVAVRQFYHKISGVTICLEAARELRGSIPPSEMGFQLCREAPGIAYEFNHSYFFAAIRQLFCLLKKLLYLWAH